MDQTVNQTLLFLQLTSIQDPCCRRPWTGHPSEPPIRILPVHVERYPPPNIHLGSLLTCTRQRFRRSCTIRVLWFTSFGSLRAPDSGSTHSRRRSCSRSTCTDPSWDLLFLFARLQHEVGTLGAPSSSFTKAYCQGWISTRIRQPRNWGSQVSNLVGILATEPVQLEVIREHPSHLSWNPQTRSHRDTSDTFLDGTRESARRTASGICVSKWEPLRLGGWDLAASSC